jgi:DNA (cytosine-5)-methyltransferase 1
MKEPAAHRNARRLRPLISAICGASAALLAADENEPTSPRNQGLDKESWYTLMRCSWDHPARTLTASGQQPDYRAGAVHPAENRKFTIPELKRLFGLPDDYVFTGTIAQAAERMGNMVPPFLTRALAERVYEVVLRPYAERRR